MDLRIWFGYVILIRPKDFVDKIQVPPPQVSWCGVNLKWWWICLIGRKSFEKIWVLLGRGEMAPDGFEGCKEPCFKRTRGGNRKGRTWGRLQGAENDSQPIVRKRKRKTCDTSTRKWALPTLKWAYKWLPKSSLQMGTQPSNTSLPAEWASEKSYLLCLILGD